MKRGFPRPTIHIEKCNTNYPEDGYGEKWDNKTYPVPYTADEDSISTLHSGRTQECTSFKRCIVCGKPVKEQIVSVLYKTGALVSESGPFHESCARLTEKLCPHIAENASYQFARVEWNLVKPEVQEFFLDSPVKA